MDSVVKGVDAMDQNVNQSRKNPDPGLSMPCRDLGVRPSLRLSQSYFPMSKHVSLDGISGAEAYLLRSGALCKLDSGIFSFLPSGQRIQDRLHQEIELCALGFGSQHIYLPTLQPKSFWVGENNQGRWDQFSSDLFVAKAGKTSAEYVLNPSSEECISRLLAKSGGITKDSFPIKLHHTDSHFRFERGARGLQRAFEFPMHEMYAFSLTRDEVEECHAALVESYTELLKRLKVKVAVSSPALSEATGHITSNFYSFGQALLNEEMAASETVVISKRSGEIVQTAVKESQIGDLDPNDFTVEKTMRIAQVATLGNRYSKENNLFVIDSNKQTIHPHAVAGGISPSRLMLAIVESNHENGKVFWPAIVAPFVVCISNLIAQDENTARISESLYQRLSERGISVVLDDRHGVSAGMKLNTMELLGSPVQIVIGKNFLNSGEFEVRTIRGDFKTNSLDAIFSAIEEA